MSIAYKIAGRIRRVTCGLDTWGEFALWCADKIGSVVTLNKYPAFRKSLHYRIARNHRLAETFRSTDGYRIKDIHIPPLEFEEEGLIFGVFDDTFYSYAYLDDSYSEETFDYVESFLGEGLYGLVNDKVNITVKPGDIVIDAGSSAGDFAAYASVKGAVTYAFEPSPRRLKLLRKTAELNPRIIPVDKALGASESFNAKISSVDTSEREVFDVTTIDDFVRENNLPRVDFIKADIEGFERHMLAGAQETLARFAPKLALCTYHLPDDPQVMAGLIKQANPRYNIVQKRKKLFASVPKD